MSQTITFQLNDETFKAIRSHAECEGKTPEHWIANTLEQLYCGNQLQNTAGDSQLQTARERFEKHFGEIDLGYATGASNDQIDADLVKAYADNPEE